MRLYDVYSKDFLKAVVCAEDRDEARRLVAERARAVIGWTEDVEVILGWKGFSDAMDIKEAGLPLQEYAQLTSPTILVGFMSSDCEWVDLDDE